MKMSFVWLLLLVPLGVAAVYGQVDFPGNPLVGPKKYTTRQVGGGADPGVKVNPANPEAGTRQVTHIVLCDSRWWTSAEGKPLEAKLLAFEDIITEIPKGGTPTTVAAPPARPTVIREGKARLLVNKKPVELALDRLCEGDRDFIEGIERSLARKAEGK